MEPTITDWIQAIGMILGFPAALWGVVSLFKKDKARQEEIKSLVSLAQSQATMIDKISEQINNERQKHLLSIRPFFNVLKEPAVIPMSDAFTLEITNTGARAKFKNFIEDFNKTVEFYEVVGVDHYIENGMNVSISGICKGDLYYLKDAFYGVFLNFEDVEGNTYYQQLIKQDNGHFIREPILYTGSLEDNIRRTRGNE
jgi:hypothetical protein